MKAFVRVALGVFILAGCGGRVSGQAVVAVPADGSANAVGVPAVELEAGSEPIDAPPPSSAFFDGAAEASAALTPPVSVQGLALWLDGTAGLSANDPRGGIGTWADRSGFGHVFVGQEQPGCAGPPQPGWLNGRGAVSFVGVCSASGGAQNRLVSEPYPTSTQMDALTLDPLGFALAVVFQGQAAMDGPGFLAVVTQPWWNEHEEPPQVTSPVLTLEISPTGVDFGIGGGVGLEGLPISPPLDLLPHLLVLTVTPNEVTVRFDAKPFLDMTTGSPSVYVPVSYAPIYIGGWDWGLDGFTGLIGDFILIKGDGGADMAALESYLMQKYGL